MASVVVTFRIMPDDVEVDLAKMEEDVLLLVNRHGAMILCPVRYPEGSMLEVFTMATRQSARFRVVWSGGEDLPGRYKVGLELLDERPSFWGPEYEKCVAAADE